MARRRRKEHPCQKEAAMVGQGLSPEVADKCVWFKFWVAGWECYMPELKHQVMPTGKHWEAVPSSNSEARLCHTAQEDTAHDYKFCPWH